MYIKINEECEVIVKSANKKRALVMLEEKAAWIEKKLQACREKKQKKAEAKRAHTIFYLGDALGYEKVEGKRNTLTFHGDHFTVSYKDEEALEKLIERFYKEQAAVEIPKLVSWWAKKMDVLYHSEITFRKMKRRLGSCSFKNELTFNTLLMKLKIEQIEYVVVHELAHITHKNHSRDFWKRVEMFLPEYKHVDKEIGMDY